MTTAEIEQVMGGLFVTNPYSNTSVFQVDEQTGNVILIDGPPGTVWDSAMGMFNYPFMISNGPEPIYKQDDKGYDMISFDNGENWEYTLDTVTIYGQANNSNSNSQSSIESYQGYLKSFYSLIYGNTNQGGGGSGGGGGGSNSGDNNSTTGYTFSEWMDIASGAVSTASSFNEYYATMDALRLGTVSISTTEILKNIFDSNPAGTFKNEIQAASKLNGIAILSTAGKILGITSAGVSLYNLYDDITDGDGQVSTGHILDAAISVGSLFIKSNVVGVTVSMGWLLIKGEFEE